MERVMMTPQMPIEACEACGSADAVRTKLIATHILVNAGSWHRPELRMSHDVVDEEAFRASPFVVGDQFISALYCDSCETGFIPESQLSDMGVAPSSSR